MTGLKKKWAFLGVKPHIGGTWTVFENLRTGLSLQGIELRWVVAGKINASVLQESDWTAQCEWGEVVAPDEAEDSLVAVRLKGHLVANYDGCIVNVLCDRLCTNLMRYLEPSFPRIMMVHNTTIGTYVAASSIRDYVHETVGVSKRIVEDLIRGYKFNKINTRYIPNAVQVTEFDVDRVTSCSLLNILVLSRIEDQSKGCFHVPEILKKIGEYGIPYHCTIVGDGPDLEELKKRCETLEVSFLGRVPRGKVPNLVAKNDVYLFPSIYEGFGLSLVEAMAGGCVPVSSRLVGVTDGIVVDGESGFLLKPGDVNGFANALMKIYLQPDLHSFLSNNARERAERTFSINSISTKFAELIHYSECSSFKVGGKIKACEKWRYPRGLRRGLRTFLPDYLKKILRNVREKVRQERC